MIRPRHPLVREERHERLVGDDEGAGWGEPTH
jgi:hypothetical protein